MDADRVDLAALREEYELGGLEEGDLPPEPMELFDRWLAEAVAAQLHEPNAMVVSTSSPQGVPSSRFVLLKEIVEQRFCFYTNLESRKGRELRTQPAVALLFPWHPLQRQVRIEGTAEVVPRPQAEAYFATRPRGAQLGAWASAQSHPVADRAELDRAHEQAEARFAGGPVPCPPHWGGFAVAADRYEFWQGRSGRMHDRLVYERADGAAWRVQRLAP